jgi:hypothetical protein
MAEILRLDIPILLPDVPDAADACVTRLIGELKGRSGVESVHVRPAFASGPAQLCIHYDAETLPLSRIRELVTSAGLTSRSAMATWLGRSALRINGAHVSTSPAPLPTTRARIGIRHAPTKEATRISIILRLNALE